MACDGPCAAPLSFGDLETLWINAGGPAVVAPIAAAIAAAESSGISNNTNPTDNGGTQTSWGLWQISDGTHNAFANWSTPADNAAAAVAKYKAAGGFSPWGTFTSGSYLAHLHDANANGTMGTGAAATPTTSSGAASGFSPASLSSQASTLIIVFAALVLLIGIWAMTRPAPPKMAAA